MLLQIKDGLEHHKTENDILQDKLKRALREHGDVEDDKERQQREAEVISYYLCLCHSLSVSH